MLSARSVPIAVLVGAAALNLLAVGGAQAGEPEDSLKKVDQLLELRPALEKIDEARRVLDRVLQNDPKCYGALWRMVRVLYYRGKFGPEAERLDVYEKAVEWGKKAVEANDGAVEGHFWLAVAYGLYGEERGVMKSLFLVDDIEAECKRVIEIDPKYEGGGGHRIFGRVKFKVPGLFGGSNREALEHLRKALELGPTMPLNYSYLADVLYDEDEEEEARKLIAGFQAMPVDPYWKTEHEEAMARCREILKDME